MTCLGSLSSVLQLKGGGAAFSDFSILLLSTKSAPVVKDLGSWETTKIGFLGSLLTPGIAPGTKASAFIRDLERKFAKAGWALGGFYGMKATTFYVDWDLNSEFFELLSNLDKSRRDEEIEFLC